MFSINTVKIDIHLNNRLFILTKYSIQILNILKITKTAIIKDNRKKTYMKKLRISTKMKSQKHN